MGDSISKALGPPSPLFPDPNLLLLAEESGGAQPNQQVAVILEKTGGTSWLGGKKRSINNKQGSFLPIRFVDLFLALDVT
jgi:hypothetical protein